MIQIVAINAGTLAELLFLPREGRALTPRETTAGREKGGVRIAKAAFEAGITGILARFRFTAR
ncbi:hypothetical protein ACWAT4_16135 [Bradyrhizobium manausense]